MTQRIVDTKAKCPKCKSTDLLLIEEWEGHTITWEQIEGNISISSKWLQIWKIEN